MSSSTADAPHLAPAGSLRAGIWMLPFFARESDGAVTGLVPDLANELARRLGVPARLLPFGNPAHMIAAFRAGALDVTFLGITADRAAAVDFGPVVLSLQTTYLVPASSGIAAIAEIDRPGMRVAVPANSAQEAHLRKTIVRASLLPVPAETPGVAVSLLASGEADAFSHVAPMLASVQRELPGARILPGSYYNVPIAIGVARGRPPEACLYARQFAEEAIASGFVQQAIDRAGVIGVQAGG
jgi:polar amino acid transport system substrate-binding protein